MVNKNKKRQLGWLVPKLARQKFIDFCQSIGSLAQDEAAGALLFWITLPPTTREEYKLLAKGLGATGDPHHV